MTWCALWHGWRSMIYIKSRDLLFHLSTKIPLKQFVKLLSFWEWKNCDYHTFGMEIPNHFNIIDQLRNIFHTNRYHHSLAILILLFVPVLGISFALKVTLFLHGLSDYDQDADVHCGMMILLLGVNDDGIKDGWWCLIMQSMIWQNIKLSATLSVSSYIEIRGGGSVSLTSTTFIKRVQGF